MSFQRMISSGSIPVANSEATAWRTTRSPAFPSRWISTSQRLHVDRLERTGPAALGDVPEDLVGDAVTLPLADEDVARQRRLIREVGQQVAHEDGGLLDVRAARVEQREELRIRLGVCGAPHALDGNRPNRRGGKAF